jgi:type IV secretion system protein VirB9
MIRKFSFAALVLFASTATVAAPDSRIRTLAYDANEIVKIHGKTGIQSTIEFSSDEKIENVAVGDSSAWQITPNKRASLLFVKPLNARSRTNMTVVTDRRTYMFDLVAGDASGSTVYALKFSYPNEKPVKAAVQPVQQAAVNTASPATVTAEKLHFDWKSKGHGKLTPNRMFDDGTSLYLAWDKETPLPAILTQAEDKKEGPVNYRMSGEYIVVSPVPQNVVLRYGSKVAVLWPTRRIVPASPAPVRQDSRVAMAVAAPVQAHPVSAQPQPAPAQANTLKLANVTALYSDKLTDTADDR